MIRYLGTHMVNWLVFSEVPLFISRNRLKGRKSFPKANCRWALDSGGFTELQRHGGWTITAAEYAAEVRRYSEAIGEPDFVAPQDWMCEKVVREGGWLNGQNFIGTGLSVHEHQRRTVENFLELRSLAPEIRFIPVLQGEFLPDYKRCAQMYAEVGVDLTGERLVGLGSICRRQGTEEIREIAEHFATQGLRLHGFGVKTLGLRSCASAWDSVDSTAWSIDARYKQPLPGCKHKNCANCPKYAFAWHGRQAQYENA